MSKKYILIAIPLLLGFAWFTRPQNKLSNDAQRPSLDKVEAGKLIIRFKSDYQAKASKTDAQFQALLKSHHVEKMEQGFPHHNHLQKKGSDILRNIYFLEFDSNEHPYDVAQSLAKQEGILYAEPRYLNFIQAVPNDEHYNVAGRMAGFTRVNAEAAWDVVKGEQGNVVVAVVDGGTAIQHPDLTGNLWVNAAEIAGNNLDDDGNGKIDDIHGWNFPDNKGDPTNNNPSSPLNAEHGTHTAGTAVGRTNNSVGVASISWNAKLMAINVASKTSDRSFSYGYEGVEYAATKGASVISCSWGGEYYSAYGQDIVNFATQNGALVVAAAGNDNKNNDQWDYSPANLENVLQVGSTLTTSDARSSFSNYGVSTDVFAPGSGILSTIPGTTAVPFGYANLSGTSMATPMVAGLVALLKTAKPNYTPQQLTEQIRVTADNIDAANPSLTGLLGRGRINAHRAVTDFSKPSLRIQQVTFTDASGNGIIQSGENITVTVKYKNLLPATATNVSAAFAATSGGAVVNQSGGVLGSINGDGTGTITFSFTAPNAADGTKLKFSSTLSGNQYNDKEFLTLTLNPPQFVVHDTGRVQTSATSRSNFGYNGFADPNNGAGFSINGTQILFEGGFMLGTAPNKVSDGIRGAGSLIDNDWQPKKGTFLNLYSPGEKSKDESRVVLVDSIAPNPTYVEVLQEMYSDTSAVNKDFVIFKYTLTNKTAVAMDNVHFAMFADWDIANGGANDYAAYDNSKRMGYVMNNSTQSTSTVFGAFKPLNIGTNTPIFRAINNTTEIYGGTSGDGYTAAEKWNHLVGGVSVSAQNYLDVSIVTGFTIPTLLPNTPYQVAFATIGANSFTQLNNAADAAQLFWNNKIVATDREELPTAFTLAQSFPNPFTQETQIDYQLGETERVKMEVYNVLGQKVRTLVHTNQEAGKHTVIWDGKDDHGNRVSSGTYFYRLQTKSFNRTRSLAFLR